MVWLNQVTQQLSCRQAVKTSSTEQNLKTPPVACLPSSVKPESGSLLGAWSREVP